MGLDFLSDYDRRSRIHEDRWTYSVDLGLAMANPDRRMVAVRRDRSRWALISPVPLDAAARAELLEKGEVEALIVPTAFHNAFVPESCDAFPDAVSYLTRGAERVGVEKNRRRRLPGDLPPEWVEALDPVLLDGMPRGNEVVFHHRSSRTLLVSDLCFEFDRRSPAGTRFLFRLFGAYPGLRKSRLFRLMIRNREAFRCSFDSLLERHFDRVVMSHGIIVESDGQQRLQAQRP
jgi:hypothetical protein